MGRSGARACSEKWKFSCSATHILGSGMLCVRAFFPCSTRNLLVQGCGEGVDGHGGQKGEGIGAGMVGRGGEKRTRPSSCLLGVRMHRGGPHVANAQIEGRSQPVEMTTVGHLFWVGQRYAGST